VPLQDRFAYELGLACVEKAWVCRKEEVWVCRKEEEEWV
jgi:hypothetical protein